MPNALRMSGAGRKASPPKNKNQGLPSTAMDAHAAKERDTLNGAKRDILGQARGPAWLRQRYSPRAAGGATREPV